MFAALMHIIRTRETIRNLPLTIFEDNISNVFIIVTVIDISGKLSQGLAGSLVRMLYYLLFELLMTLIMKMTATLKKVIAVPFKILF